ncbi:MAG TPA: YqjK-like family protein [Rhodocyclaceae bacterium]|nr:YqjK-like family protein [Rhodocyclaceae bacterium]
MSDVDLALKKQRLILKSTALRASMVEDVQPLQPLFTGADRVVMVIHWIQQRPQLIAAALVASLVLRPRKVLRWGRRGFVLWKTWQKIQTLRQA